MMKTTLPVRYEENGTQYRIAATYGIDYEFGRKHNQAPDFSLTARIDRLAGRRWMEDGGGCCHDRIVKHIPNLKPLVQWHLVSTRQPLHYLANARYWWEKATGRSQWKTEPGENPPEFFKSTVVWGALPTDTDLELAKMMDRGLVHMTDTLQARLPALMEKFAAVIKQWGVLES